MTIYNDNSYSIGNTPLVRLKHFGNGNIVVKIEGRNPSFSVKCRIGANMVWQAEKDGSFRLTVCTNLFRYTGGEYYTLRPIITGKRWRLAVPPESTQTVFMLGWKCVAPLKEDIKLCFEDDDTRLYFSLRKGKTYGLISSCYRLPPNRRICTLELSTVGAPHSRGELIPDSIVLTLEKQL